MWTHNEALGGHFRAEWWRILASVGIGEVPPRRTHTLDSTLVLPSSSEASPPARCTTTTSLPAAASITTAPLRSSGSISCRRRAAASQTKEPNQTGWPGGWYSPAGTTTESGGTRPTSIRIIIVVVKPCSSGKQLLARVPPLNQRCRDSATNGTTQTEKDGRQRWWRNFRSREYSKEKN